MISSGAVAIPKMITIIECKCGAEYSRTDTKFLTTHKGNAFCEVCGSILESWDNTHVPSFELIKRPDREPDRALDGRGETFATMGH
jgi:hypothetical protein